MPATTEPAAPAAADDMPEQCARGEKLLDQVTDAAAKLFPLSEAKVAEFAARTEELAALCRQVLQGDGSAEWRQILDGAASFAALGRQLEARSQERQEKQRREAYRRFLEKLLPAIGRLELKPIANRIRKQKAESELAEVKEFARNVEPREAADRPLPAGWDPSIGAEEWLRTKLLDAENPPEARELKEMLQFDDALVEKLLFWQDLLVLR